MHRKKIFVVMTIVSLLFIGSRSISAQSPDEDGHRFEVGAQFSVLNLTRASATHLKTNPCLVPPCPSDVRIDYAQEAEPGIGGRISYHLNNHVALEAEANFFPRDRGQDGGREFEGLFGVKAGWRFEKFGIFAKARPGFLSSHAIEFRPRPGTVCPAVVPPPIGCFEEVERRETNFAFDIGGVVEIYPTKRTVIRFDAGDTIVRFEERRVRAPSEVFTTNVVVPIPARTSHMFQGSIGIGFRF